MKVVISMMMCLNGMYEIMNTIVNDVMTKIILGALLIKSAIFVIELSETVKNVVKRESVTHVTMVSISLRALLSVLMSITLNSVRMKLLMIGSYLRMEIGDVVNVLKVITLILTQKSVKSVHLIMLSLVQPTRFLNVKMGLRSVLMNKLVLK